ncbi:PREDICTED: tyrosine-protein kinase-like, partial [Amphimedon queenslandica]|uniref:Tyrosine-protein kinase n=1 Tax=Amphimedon queenslandica TaxID=400682 RepID=A0AAN0JH03_AMPQE
LLPSINRHYKCVYYHIVSRLEAEERLSQADTQSGTFLIRESESRPGSCSLSLNFRGSILHYLLYNHNNTYCISDQVKFNSLNELLQYYMLIADYLPCTLTVPVFKPVNRLIERDERWEIEKSSIRVMNCTDIREFGEIFMGYWHNKGSVLIKTNITADITQERFLKEANILKKLNYESIICLYGVCTKEYPFYIVTELMNHGNLKKHLSRYSFAPAELIYITAQVVNGMIYLGEQYYIHCDLRAANILVGEYNTVKIANFHFAQHLNGNKYWIIEERTKLAIRWTAPEWHTLNRLGIKSDVWSFGILLWELVTKGNLPYPGMTNVEVVEAVPQGYRMIIPEDCPEPFQQLMVNCWEQNDDERPRFEDIFETLVKHKNSFI